MDKEKNLTQNQPAKPAEAPQEAEKAQAPSEGGVNAEVTQGPSSEATGVVSEDVTVAPRGRETIMLDEELVMSEPATAVTEAVPVVEKRAMAEVAGPKPAKKSHKGLVITIIVTVILALGAGAAWWFLAGPGTTTGEQETDEVQSDEKRPSGSGSLRPISTKPNYGGSGVATIKLADVPTGVMEFYETVVTTPYGVETVTSDASRWWLYADSEVAQGRIPKYLMLEIAYDGLDFNEKWSRCKGEYYYFNDESRGRVTDYCVDAARIRDRVKEIFDIEIELNADDHVGTHNRVEICGTKDYSVENDEFYTTDDGCGGNDPRHIQHWLTKAEKVGDEIWLYETAVYSDSNSLATIGANVDDGEIILENFGEYSQQYNLNYDPKNITDLAITDKFNEYIWKFKKDADDRYVFEGLEKVK